MLATTTVASITLNTPCYSWFAVKRGNQSATSTCFDPAMVSGSVHQQSTSTRSWSVCWWQWGRSAGRSSSPDRSWRRVCSSRSVVWFHDGQTQFSLKDDWSRPCWSRSWNHSERPARNESRKNIGVKKKEYILILKDTLTRLNSRDKMSLIISNATDCISNKILGINRDDNRNENPARPKTMWSDK